MTSCLFLDKKVSRGSWGAVSEKVGSGADLAWVHDNRSFEPGFVLPWTGGDQEVPHSSIRFTAIWRFRWAAAYARSSVSPDFSCSSPQIAVAQLFRFRLVTLAATPNVFEMKSPCLHTRRLLRASKYNTSCISTKYTCSNLSPSWRVPESLFVRSPNSSKG